MTTKNADMPAMPCRTGGITSAPDERIHSGLTKREEMSLKILCKLIEGRKFFTGIEAEAVELADRLLKQLEGDK